MTLKEAGELFSRHRISGAPVIGDDGHLLGVLSQTDLLREAFEDQLRGVPENVFFVGLPFLDEKTLHSEEHRLSSITVEEVMNTEVISCSAHDSPAVLASQMRQHHIHRLPVVDGEKLVGIVSSFDLLALIERAPL